MRLFLLALILVATGALTGCGDGGKSGTHTNATWGLRMENRTSAVLEVIIANMAGENPHQYFIAAEGVHTWYLGGDGARVWVPIAGGYIDITPTSTTDNPGATGLNDRMVYTYYEGGSILHFLEFGAPKAPSSNG